MNSCKIRNLHIAALASFFLCSAAAGFAAAVNQLDLSSPLSMCLGKDAVDAKSILQNSLERIHGIKAYSLETVLTTYSDKGLVVETGNLYFKSPNLLRFEVLKAGSRSGSVLVREADGKIEGTMGGFLKGLKVSFSPASKLLKSANGFSILDSDLETLLSRLYKNSNPQMNCLALKSPEIVELLESDGDVAERVVFDSEQDIPSQWSIFRAKKLFSVLKLSNLKTRPELTDEFFSLGSRSSAKSLDEESPPSVLLSLLKNPRLKPDLSLFQSLQMELQAISNALSTLERVKKESKVAFAEEACDFASRATVLNSTLKIESALTLMEPFGLTLQYMSEAKPQSAEWSKSWTAALQALNESVDELIEECQLEYPNFEKIEKERVKIAALLLELKNTLQKAEALL
ncbi:MAG: hypothetical protein K2X27_13530 [Candidatus Obscuribacterales bacterium]|nr:hypothetical protein [Candidatus Obscuribacterales bacterium]